MMTMIIYMVMIVLSHLLIFYIASRNRERLTFFIDLEKIFRLFTEYYVTNSLLRSKIVSGFKIDKEDLFNEHPSLLREGINLDAIVDRDIGITQMKAGIERLILNIEEELNKLDLYGILVAGSITFPLLLTSLTILLVGPLTLVVTPIIQWVLLLGVRKWMKR